MTERDELPRSRVPRSSTSVAHTVCPDGCRSGARANALPAATRAPTGDHRSGGPEAERPGWVGELTTFVSNHGYSYPQLWVVQSDVDYTRFDRFHVNISEGGIGVDEVLQVISGRGVVIRLRLLSGRTLTLRLDCPREGAGWLVTYNGGKPHSGSLSGAKLGTKVVAQVIGPARWALRYEDDE